MPVTSNDFAASSPIIKLPNSSKMDFQFKSQLTQTQINNDSQAFAKLLLSSPTPAEVTQFLNNHTIDVGYRYPISDSSSRSLFYLAATSAKNLEAVQYLLNLGANISENALYNLMRDLQIQTQATKSFAILKIIADFSGDAILINHLKQFELGSFKNYDKLYLDLADNIIKHKALNFKDFNQIPLENFNQQILSEFLLKGLKQLNLIHNNTALKTLKETIDDIVPGKNLLLYSVQQTLDNCIKREIIINTIVDNDICNENDLLEKLESLLIGTIYGISTHSFKIYEQLLASNQAANAELLFTKQTINFYNNHSQYKTPGNFLKNISEEQLQRAFNKGCYEELKKLLYINALDLKTQDKIINALYEYELLDRNNLSLSSFTNDSLDSSNGMRMSGEILPVMTKFSKPEPIDNAKDHSLSERQMDPSEESAEYMNTNVTGAGTEYSGF